MIKHLGTDWGGEALPSELSMQRAKAVTRAVETLTDQPSIYQGKLFQPVLEHRACS